MSTDEIEESLERLIERYNLSVACSLELRKLIGTVEGGDTWNNDYTPSVSLDDPYSTDEVALQSVSRLFVKKNDSEESSKIGRYLDLGILGKGGVGLVHLVYDDRLNRKIALKIIHKHLEDDKIS